jgi:hypothetical protein
MFPVKLMSELELVPKTNKSFTPSLFGVNTFGIKILISLKMDTKFDAVSAQPDESVMVKSME